MLNREKHQLIMGRVLRDIYADTSIAPLLGLKGGTCAYFFYGLPRFSVDLDFDLLTTNETDQTSIFEKIKKILEHHGEIKDSQIKRHTIFFLLSYGDTDHNIKVEINTRQHIPAIQNQFELKDHLGMAMVVGKPAYLFASKLAALTLRNQTAMRDIYDIWYFATNNWDINTVVLKLQTHKNVSEHLADCLAIIEQVKNNQILQGLGELLSEKDKTWVKTHLRQEVIFLLKNYQSVFK